MYEWIQTGDFIRVSAETRKIPTVDYGEESACTGTTSSLLRDERTHAGYGTAGTLFHQLPAIVELLYRVVRWEDVSGALKQRRFIINAMKGFLQTSRCRDAPSWFGIVPHRVVWSRRFDAKEGAKQNTPRITYHPERTVGVHRMPLLRGHQLDSRGAMLARPLDERQAGLTIMSVTRSVRCDTAHGPLLQPITERRACLANEDYVQYLRLGRVPAASDHYDGSIATSVMLRMSYATWSEARAGHSRARSLSVTFTRDGFVSSIRETMSSVDALMATDKSVTAVLQRIAENRRHGR